MGRLVLTGESPRRCRAKLGARCGGRRCRQVEITRWRSRWTARCGRGGKTAGASWPFGNPFVTTFRTRLSGVPSGFPSSLEEKPRLPYNRMDPCGAGGTTSMASWVLERWSIATVPHGLRRGRNPVPGNPPQNGVAVLARFLMRGQLLPNMHEQLGPMSQLQNSFTQLRSGRSLDVVHWDFVGTDALRQGLATGAIGCIPTECQVKGYRLFYRAMHPYAMPGFAISSHDCAETAVRVLPSLYQSTSTWPRHGAGAMDP